ncbi:MAG TPA: plastocyanin/azurin family copper-binding protein [Candidatus Nitrosotalea sp.]|nr:plastocyanin/azurin family copper-binding protein [Candidatus Nitrosotalea sp.]
MSPRLAATLVVVLALVTVGAALPALAQKAAEVTIIKGAGADQSCVSAGNCFDPSKLDVSPGTTVTWTNTDQVSHTVTSGNPSDNQTGTVFDSSLIAPNKKFTFTFNTPGTFHYFCQVHPWMTGEVIVGQASGASAPEFGGAAPIVLALSIMAVVLTLSIKTGRINFRV